MCIFGFSCFIRSLDKSAPGSGNAGPINRDDPAADAELKTVRIGPRPLGRRALMHSPSSLSVTARTIVKD
jgi:hypothetical protein